jgi:hypothetical protein
MELVEACNSFFFIVATACFLVEYRIFPVLILRREKIMFTIDYRSSVVVRHQSFRPNSINNKKEDKMYVCILTSKQQEIIKNKKPEQVT